MKTSVRSSACPRSKAPLPIGVFCPYCYSNLKRRGNYPGHKHYVRRHVPCQYVEYIMKRETPAKPPKKGEVAYADGDFGGRYPCVSNYLCDVWWDDGKPREPSSLSIKMDAAYVHVGLMDHAMGRSVYCTAPSLPEALGMLEALLASGEVSWRAWKRGK